MDKISMKAPSCNCGIVLEWMKRKTKILCRAVCSHDYARRVALKIRRIADRTRQKNATASLSLLDWMKPEWLWFYCKIVTRRFWIFHLDNHFNCFVNHYCYPPWTWIISPPVLFINSSSLGISKQCLYCTHDVSFFFKTSTIILIIIDEFGSKSDWSIRYSSLFRLDYLIQPNHLPSQ